MTLQGKPTYEATHYAPVASLQNAIRMSKLLVEASVFFSMEPMPDDLWYFYVKEESSELLETLAYAANKGGQAPR